MFSALSWLKPATYAATFAAGVFVMGLYHSAAISNINESVALERQAYSEKLQSESSRLQKEVAKVDEYHYQKYQRELSAVPEPERVYIRAKCPGLPVAGNSSVDDGARAELDAASKRLVSELRRRVVRLENKLAAWQALKSPQ